MKHKVVLLRSEEGVSASVPGLPGCWSQGQDEEEALENISSAVQEYLPLLKNLRSGLLSGD
jgi:predicted RNase H-like HicB family nuclease